jgi:hypothetical protein
VNGVTVFFAEVAASLAISSLILVRLQHLLREIGNDVCERGGGATEFWLAYTQLMMLVAPVLLISWFSGAGSYGTLVAQLKSSFGVVLSGQFIGLALVGRAVWKSIVRPAPEAPRAPVSILPDGSPA